MAPQFDFPRRALRVLLSLALLAVAMAGVLAIVAVRTGRAIALDSELQHRVAYAWVIATVVAAVAAYALAGGAGERPRPGFARALAVGALTDLAALGGAAAFFFVPVWPILAIAALVALLGLVLAWPRPDALEGSPRQAVPAEASPPDAPTDALAQEEPAEHAGLPHEV